MHTTLSAAFYSQHTAVGNGAINKFRICFQWRTEHFMPECCYTQRHERSRSWQRADDVCTLHCTECAIRPVRLLHHVFLSLRRDEFHARVGN
jgi:hypothetical protein